MNVVVVGIINGGFIVIISGRYCYGNWCFGIINNLFRCLIWIIGFVKYWYCYWIWYYKVVVFKVIGFDGYVFDKWFNVFIKICNNDCVVIIVKVVFIGNVILSSVKWI